ncbi:MerR family transcriptional regulator [Liquorilactobacillus satsumensis]|uniref:MerR family transcriptional regulator n=1 Tax=Liquorilactobacillus satsumensis TaxID=259059 RepID=UPI0021C28DC4|nr:MerR family transcriptional regulator [Liquorilactobacillus satsumensis]MCP9328533.1 MerR family transcriptional regulator [Liquorilactobacillus satsumensis]
MYTIQKVAEIVQLSPHTVRFYAKKGLFPRITRDQHNVRLFSNKDLEYVEIVKALRTTGMSLRDIKKYIDLCEQGEATVEQRYQIMKAEVDKSAAKLAESHRQHELLAEKLKYYQQARLKGEKQVMWAPQHRWTVFNED